MKCPAGATGCENEKVSFRAPRPGNWAIAILPQGAGQEPALRAAEGNLCISALSAVAIRGGRKILHFMAEPQKQTITKKAKIILNLLFRVSVFLRWVLLGSKEASHKPLIHSILANGDCNTVSIGRPKSPLPVFV